MPDGRRAGAPSGSRREPQSYGAEKNGLLASLNSVAKLPYEWALDGISNTQTINPDALGHSDDRACQQPGTGNGRLLRSGRSSPERKRIRYREAASTRMEHPEKPEYANFTIRVSGYAVKFIDLTKEQQMDVISRTCHATM